MQSKGDHVAKMRKHIAAMIAFAIAAGWQ